MRLNLPILDHLKDCQNILIAGAGGGFDVFAGLPIYFTLRDAGKNVHLANYSFMDLTLAKLISQPIIEMDGLLIGAQGAMRHNPPYYPEGYLAQWFKEAQNEDTVVWVLDRRGAVPLANAYQHLVKKFDIQAVILVDGGVDSLMRGDETAPGTLIEDSISLAALSQVPVAVKLLACIGFGTEVEENLCHHHALENMAGLAKVGAFYGVCALTKAMPAFQKYEAACRYAWETREDNHKSHIHTRVIPAVQGEFDNFQMYTGYPNPVFISPLMSLFWFFNAQTVFERNTLAQRLVITQTPEECRNIGMQRYVSEPNKRPIKRIPY
jgi:hypothetical protein